MIATSRRRCFESAVPRDGAFSLSHLTLCPTGSSCGQQGAADIVFAGTVAQADAYLANVEALGDRFAAFGPVLVLYQAGADTHVDDPLGGMLTSEQMRVRDRAVFRAGRAMGIPVAWNLAGGYQIEVDGTIPRVVALHLATFGEASVSGIASEMRPAGCLSRNLGARPLCSTRSSVWRSELPRARIVAVQLMP